MAHEDASSTAAAMVAKAHTLPWKDNKAAVEGEITTADAMPMGSSNESGLLLYDSDRSYRDLKWENLRSAERNDGEPNEDANVRFGRELKKL